MLSTRPFPFKPTLSGQLRPSRNFVGFIRRSGGYGLAKTRHLRFHLGAQNSSFTRKQFRMTQPADSSANSSPTAPIAIVLAAGKGTRMQSDLPKVLCPAAGRPLIGYVIDALRDAGVQQIVVVVGYRADEVKRQLADIEGLTFVLQDQQLGTGHAVMMARDAIADHQGGVVIVAGDSPMLQADSLRNLLLHFEQNRCAGVLGSLIHENPTGLGRIVRDQTGKFTGIVEEKDASDQQRAIAEVNMSTYVFDCQKLIATLDRLTSDNQQNEYYITDVPAILLEDDEDVRALPVLQPIESLSVNTVEHLAAVEDAMAKLAATPRPE